MDEDVEAALMRAGAQIEVLQRENAALRPDAQRYRRLGWLVEFGDWSVGKHTIKSKFGDTDVEYMDDKEHMDRTLDLPEVIAEAEASERVLCGARNSVSA